MISKTSAIIAKMTSKADRDFLYPRNLRFGCTRCVLCCGDTRTRVRHILMLEAEANRISNETSKPVKDFAHRIRGKMPYVYEMKKTRTGKCLFLEKDLCSIYLSRPLICRYYPFQLEMLRNRVYDFSFSSECPGVGKGKRLRKDYFEKLFQEACEKIGWRRPSRNRTD